MTEEVSRRHFHDWGSALLTFILTGNLSRFPACLGSFLLSFLLSRYLFPVPSQFLLVFPLILAELGSIPSSWSLMLEFPLNFPLLAEIPAECCAVSGSCWDLPRIPAGISFPLGRWYKGLVSKLKYNFQCEFCSGTKMKYSNIMH